MPIIANCHGILLEWRFFWDWLTVRECLSRSWRICPARYEAGKVILDFQHRIDVLVGVISEKLVQVLIPAEYGFAIEGKDAEWLVLLSAAHFHRRQLFNHP